MQTRWRPQEGRVKVYLCMSRTLRILRSWNMKRTNFIMRNEHIQTFNGVELLMILYLELYRINRQIDNIMILFFRNEKLNLDNPYKLIKIKCRCITLQHPPWNVQLADWTSIRKACTKTTTKVTSIDTISKEAWSVSHQPHLNSSQPKNHKPETKDKLLSSVVNASTYPYDKCRKTFASLQTLNQHG